jgi:hypothetical protein
MVKNIKASHIQKRAWRHNAPARHVSAPQQSQRPGPRHFSGHQHWKSLNKGEKRRLEKGDFTALVRQRRVGYSLERWVFEITAAGWVHTAHLEPGCTLLQQHEQKFGEASRTPMVVSQKSPCATSLATFAPMSTPQCMPPRLSLKKNMNNKVYDTEHLAFRKKGYFHLMIDDIRRML